MNDLVERYIYDVTRRLPEAERDEVRRELKANIADMLPENPREQDIINVLTSLGTPSKMAEQYRQKQSYLISPAIFDYYISVLKPVVIVVALICGVVALTSDILQFGQTVDAAMVISNFTQGMIDGAIQAVFLVTLGFVIAERSGAYKSKAWTVDRLPKLPNSSGVAIPRVGTIVGMVLTMFFTGIIITMITRNEPMMIFALGREIIYPFTNEALIRCIPYIFATGCMSLAVGGVKLYYARWSMPVCAVNLAYNVVWVSIAVYILQWPDLLSPEFLEFAQRTFTADADILSHISDGGAGLFLSIFLIVIAVIDSAAGIWNTFKGARAKNNA